jgi:uncharacterized membrane protein YidH (DUF202 family)
MDNSFMYSAAPESLMRSFQQNLRNRYSLTRPLADSWNTMWCRRCAQDVPGVPSLEEGRFSCARCAEPLGPISTTSASSAHGDGIHRAEQDLGTAAHRPPSYDGWEIEEELRHAFRMLRSGRAGSDSDATEQEDGPRFRVDARHTLSAPHAKRSRKASKRPRRAGGRAKRRKTPVPGDRFLAAMAWSALSLGTMGFVCGLALLGWSANTGHAELQNIGSLIILAGQIALVLGLLLQLDRIWRASRHAAARLETFDEQLHDLKTSTTLLGASHGPSAAFYAHWAGGAGTDILLSDLKSQLDLLAVKLAK